MCQIRYKLLADVAYFKQFFNLLETIDLLIIIKVGIDFDTPETLVWLKMPENVYKTTDYSQKIK